MSVTYPEPPQPPQHWGVPMTPRLQQFFTTRFYFSFLLTKNIEELYIVGGQLGSPFGSKRAAYVTTSHPRAWGMKAEHLPPTLPRRDTSPTPGGLCHPSSPGGTGGWHSWALCARAATPPHTRTTAPPRRFAGLPIQSQHPTGNRLHAPGELLPAQSMSYAGRD